MNTSDALNEIKELDEICRKNNSEARHEQDLLQHYLTVCRTIPAGTHGSTPHLLKTIVRVRKHYE
ncbi:MAG: hypothetical protein J6T31_01690 [Methanobrevibacter sp.]|nr:hypothetical protein [Methanobrevibacter sp.]